MIAYKISPLPNFRSRGCVQASRARRPKSDVNAPILNYRRRRSVTIERMRVLRLLNIKKLQIVNDLAALQIGANAKQLLAIRRRRTQPDSLPFDHRPRPRPPMNRGTP